MLQRSRFWRTQYQETQRRGWLPQQLNSALGKLSILLPLSLLSVLLVSVWMQPALSAPFPSLFTVAPIASIHTYQEQPGQTTFRSKQSLRDRSDRSWQVILFKRYQAEELQGLYLRLVGFPGIVAVNQTQPIVIATGASTQWQATPNLDPQTPELPEYAAQYDVAQAISEIAGDIPLQVDIPLGDGGTAQLVVPPFAVHEWRDLNSQSPS